MLLGEWFAGEGANAAHVNVVLGDRDGPVGAAWVAALAQPSAGHAPFVVVARPSLPVQPFTLFVNKATIASEAHARLTWGAAQAGVAAGVIDALGAGTIARPEEQLLIAAVWVDPAADDADAVYTNNREATAAALRAAADGSPSATDVLAAKGDVRNAFYSPPG